MRRTPRPVLDLGGPHYRVSEIAEAFGVDSITVLRRIHAGTLEATRIGVGKGMFLVSHRALIAAGIITAASDPAAVPAGA